MVILQEVENQIVIDYEVYPRRPNDSDLLISAIETHQARLGPAPHLVAADAAFYSIKNARPQQKQLASNASVSQIAPPRAPTVRATLQALDESGGNARHRQSKSGRHLPTEHRRQQAPQSVPVLSVHGDEPVGHARSQDTALDSAFAIG
jgi:hypothetical protein